MSQILFVTRPHLIRANQSWTWPVTLKVHSIHWKFICWSVSFVFTLLRISVLWQISKTITILYEQNFFIFQNSAFKLFFLVWFFQNIKVLNLYAYQIMNGVNSRMRLRAAKNQKKNRLNMLYYIAWLFSIVPSTARINDKLCKDYYRYWSNEHNFTYGVREVVHQLFNVWYYWTILLFIFDHVMLPCKLLFSFRLLFPPL